MQNFKDWFDLVFPNHLSDEFIYCMAKTKDGKIIDQSFFQNYKEVYTFVQNHKNCDCFYGVASTNNSGHKAKDLLCANVIVLDFDFKDENGNYVEKPPLKSFIKRKFKNNGIFVSAAVDSGHGYQIYIAIEPTSNLKKYCNTIKRLQKVLGSDAKATNSTQLMRIPCSKNIKQDPVPVNVVFVCNLKELRRYSLDKLNRIAVNIDKNTSYETCFDMKPCIKLMLDGVPNGLRHFCISRIVGEFKRLKYKRSEALVCTLDFNKRCIPPLPEKEVTNTFNKLWTTEYNLFGCSIPNDDVSNNKLCSFCVKCDCDLKDNSKRKDAKLQRDLQNDVLVPSMFLNPALKLTGYEIAFLSFLSINDGKATNKEIQNKVHYSTNTINNIKNSLIKQGFIIKCKNEFRLYNTYCNTTIVPKRYIDAALGKKITKDEVKVLLTIIYFNENNHAPTLEQVSDAIKKNKSNVSKLINHLDELKLVNKDVRYVGLNKYYNLKAC